MANPHMNSVRLGGASTHKFKIYTHSNLGLKTDRHVVITAKIKGVVATDHIMRSVIICRASNTTTSPTPAWGIATSRPLGNAVLAPTP